MSWRALTKLCPTNLDTGGSIISAILNYPTEREIQTIAYQTLHTQLGSAGFIRFIQQFEQGSGNYTEERVELLGDPSVDDLFDAIGASVNLS